MPGGNSFCYLASISNIPNTFTVTNHGKYPLHNVNERIVDDSAYIRLSAMEALKMSQVNYVQLGEIRAHSAQFAGFRA